MLAGSACAWNWRHAAASSARLIDHAADIELPALRPWPESRSYQQTERRHQPDRAGDDHKVYRRPCPTLRPTICVRQRRMTLWISGQWTSCEPFATPPTSHHRHAHRRPARAEGSSHSSTMVRGARAEEKTRRALLGGTRSESSPDCLLGNSVRSVIDKKCTRRRARRYEKPDRHRAGGVNVAASSMSPRRPPGWVRERAEYRAVPTILASCGPMLARSRVHHPNSPARKFGRYDRAPH